jgi:hypothetical protein
MSDDSKTVHLVSQEGETFDVPLSVARMSELVKSMVEGELLVSHSVAMHCIQSTFQISANASPIDIIHCVLREPGRRRGS